MEQGLGGGGEQGRANLRQSQWFLAALHRHNLLHPSPYSTMTLRARVLGPNTVCSAQCLRKFGINVDVGMQSRRACMQIACICSSMPPSSILGSLADNTHQSNLLSDADKGVALNSH